MITSALSVIIAGIIPSIVGFVWYHPRVLGSLWMRSSGLQPGQAAGKHGSLWLALFGLLLGLVTAYVISLELRLVTTLPTAFMRISILWVGFVIPAVSASFLWERKSFSLYLITAFYWFLSLMAMTAVLFYLR